MISQVFFLKNTDKNKEIKTNIVITPVKKVYYTIPSDGWSTPWAETLDLVNIFFLGIDDQEKLNKAKEIAKNLGSGITENSKEATHILCEPNFDKEILKEIVIFSYIRSP